MTKIVSSEDVGIAQTYDLEVDHPDHQFYVENGLLTSNSHSDSYAVMTMQCAHLSTYHPLEFYSAVLTCAQAGDLQGYVDDIRKRGVQVLPVDVNRSKSDHVIEGNGIRLSLSSVKGLGPSAIAKVIAGQPYGGFLDFVFRSGANKTAVEALVAVGAFTELEPNMGLLLKRCDLYFSNPKFKNKKMREELQHQYDSLVCDDIDITEKMGLEREFLGFNLRGSPFSVKGRDEKIATVLEAQIAKSYQDFVESDDDFGLVPVLLKDFKERPQKRGGGNFAFMKFQTIDGLEFEAPCFSSVWKHVVRRVRKGEVYLVMFNHKPDDPMSLVVGKPGFGHSEASSMGYFLPIDDIQR